MRSVICAHLLLSVGVLCNVYVAVLGGDNKILVSGCFKDLDCGELCHSWNV